MNIIECLDNGKLVVMKSDTVYGIFCDSLNTNSIKKVYECKKRDYSKPLIILCSSKEMLYKYTKDINLKEKYLIDNYLPGLLTIILKKNDLLNDLVTAGSEFIGVRIPNDERLINIINELDRPIVSTSCNISNEDTITNVSMIEDDLIKYIDLVVDDGECNNISSTIVKVENGKVNILREGILTSRIINDKMI